jgi:PAS domain S-box-containing protein
MRDEISLMTPVPARPPAEPTVVRLPEMVLSTAVRMLTARQKLIVAVIGGTDSLGEAAGKLGVSRESLMESLRSISARLSLGKAGDLVRLARQHAVLDASPQGIYGVGTDGRCLFANRMAAEMFGYTVDQFLDADIHKLIHHSRPDGSELSREGCTILAALRSDEVEMVAEGVFWHSDGRPVWVAYNVASISMPGSSVAAVVTMDDITDRVRSAKELSISQASLEMVLEATQTVAFQVDVRTGQMVCSANASVALGLDPDATVRAYEDFLEHVHRDDRPRVDLKATAALPADELLADDIRIIPRDGEERLYRRRVRIVPDALGQPATLLGVAVDMTTLREREEAYQALVDMSSDAFIGTDAGGRITEWNPAAERIFGVPRHGAVGRLMADLIIPQRYREAHAGAVARILADPSARPRAVGPMELWGMRGDGTQFPIEATVATVPVGGTLGFRAFVRDISTRKEMEAELVHQAVTDRLTGLPNRALLSDRLAVALERLARTGSPVAVLFIDIDHFKVINDSLGHGVGDQVLRLVGQRIQSAVRPHDTVARFGGDEFVVICEGVAESEVLVRAQQLLEAPRGAGHGCRLRVGRVRQHRHRRHDRPDPQSGIAPQRCRRGHASGQETGTGSRRDRRRSPPSPGGGSLRVGLRLASCRG